MARRDDRDSSRLCLTSCCCSPPCSSFPVSPSWLLLWTLQPPYHRRRDTNRFLGRPPRRLLLDRHHPTCTYMRCTQGAAWLDLARFQVDRLGSFTYDQYGDMPTWLARTRTRHTCSTTISTVGLLRRRILPRPVRNTYPLCP